MGYALGKTGEMNGVSKSGEHRPQVTAGAIQLDELQEEIIEIGNKEKERLSRIAVWTDSVQIPTNESPAEESIRDDNEQTWLSQAMVEEKTEDRFISQDEIDRENGEELADTPNHVQPRRVPAIDTKRRIDPEWIAQGFVPPMFPLYLAEYDGLFNYQPRVQQLEYDDLWVQPMSIKQKRELWGLGIQLNERPMTMGEIILLDDQKLGSVPQKRIQSASKNTRSPCGSTKTANMDSGNTKPAYSGSNEFQNWYQTILGGNETDNELQSTEKDAPQVIPCENPSGIVPHRQCADNSQESFGRLDSEDLIGGTGQISVSSTRRVNLMSFPHLVDGSELHIGYSSAYSTQASSNMKIESYTDYSTGFQTGFSKLPSSYCPFLDTYNIGHAIYHGSTLATGYPTSTYQHQQPEDAFANLNSEDTKFLADYAAKTEWGLFDQGASQKLPSVSSPTSQFNVSHTQSLDHTQQNNSISMHEPSPLSSSPYLISGDYVHNPPDQAFMYQVPPSVCGSDGSGGGPGFDRNASYPHRIYPILNDNQLQSTDSVLSSPLSQILAPTQVPSEPLKVRNSIRAPNLVRSQSRIQKRISGVPLNTPSPPRPQPPGNRKLLAHEIKILRNFFLIVEPFRPPLNGDEDLEKWYSSWTNENLDINLYTMWSSFLKEASTPAELNLRRQSIDNHQIQVANYPKACRTWNKKAAKAARVDSRALAAQKAQLEEWGNNDEERRRKWRLEGLSSEDAARIDRLQNLVRRDVKSSTSIEELEDQFDVGYGI
ncbi:hypothetical protein EG329_011993 [Mollisiaceae sp. DMI_Dod_QoI]|nr:hypothetical protein EG329_011993 [Helotiales sp. DMI_Dod_QoI]